MDFKKIRASKNKWIIAFLALSILSVVIAYTNFPADSFFYPLVTNFGGNITSGVLGGFLFLFLTLYLDAQTEERIENIHKATLKSEAVINRRELLLKEEQDIFQFERFMKDDSYYNVRFPNLIFGIETLGLEYTIEPVRDVTTNEPIKKVTEMTSYFLVKVRGPSVWEVRKEDSRQAYENSPIKENEFYYCSYFNGSWNMSSGAGLPEWNSFYLSSKVGPVEYGETANEFMLQHNDPFKDMVKVTTILLKEDCTLMTEDGGCTPYDIYKDEEDNIYLRIWKSQPKLMYFTNPKDNYTDTDWYFVIEDIRGYASENKLRNLINVVQNELGNLNIDLKKIPWHQTKEHIYEPGF